MPATVYITTTTTKANNNKKEWKRRARGSIELLNVYSANEPMAHLPKEHMTSWPKRTLGTFCRGEPFA